MIDAALVDPTIRRRASQQIIHRTRHALRPLPQHVRVAHHRLLVLVPQKRLNGKEIRVTLERVPGKDSTKGIRADLLLDPGQLHRLLDGISYHKASPHHPRRYPADFCYRFNRRFNLAAMLPHLGYAAAHTPPMPYRLLELAQAHW